MAWSVVIPMFNGKPFIDETLSTVLAAGCPEERIIIVDDASSDDSPGYVLERYPNVTMVRRATNSKGLLTRMEGLALVRTEAFVFLDQDDLLVPEGVKRQLELLALDRDAIAVVGDFTRFSVLANGERRYWREKDRYWPSRVRSWPTATFDVNVKMQYITCWMMRTEAARAVMRVPTLGALMSQIANQDWALLCVFAGLGRVLACPEVCMHYRVRTGPAALVEPALPPPVVGEFYEALRRFQQQVRGEPATRAFWAYLETLAVANAHHRNADYTRAAAAYLKALVMSARTPSGHTRRAAGIGFLSSFRRLLIARSE